MSLSRRMPLILISALLLAALALPAAADEKVLMMATTTSTDNTGLLDYLAPKFKEATGIDLRWSATGTGKALKLGENCDVDVLMVHAPDAEMKYMGAGFGVDRRQIMYNDFVIIGPASDPAGIKGKPVKEALAAIRSKKAVFISRGDKSGTNMKELAIWQSAGGPPPDKEAWYVQTGQGMMKSMVVAAERDGYILTDRGTYITYEHNEGGNQQLKILVEGDPVLFNQYSVIAVNPKRCSAVKYDLAERYIDWISGAAGQRLIADFKLMGKPLFTPNAGK